MQNIIFILPVHVKIAEELRTYQFRVIEMCSVVWMLEHADG